MSFGSISFWLTAQIYHFIPTWDNFGVKYSSLSCILTFFGADFLEAYAYRTHSPPPFGLQHSRGINGTSGFLLPTAILVRQSATTETATARGHFQLYGETLYFCREKNKFRGEKRKKCRTSEKKCGTSSLKSGGIAVLHAQRVGAWHPELQQVPATAIFLPYYAGRL